MSCIKIDLLSYTVIALRAFISSTNLSWLWLLLCAFVSVKWTNVSVVYYYSDNYRHLIQILKIDSSLSTTFPVSWIILFFLCIYCKYFVVKFLCDYTTVNAHITGYHFHKFFVRHYLIRTIFTRNISTYPINFLLFSIFLKFRIWPAILP